MLQLLNLKHCQSCHIQHLPLRILADAALNIKCFTSWSHIGHFQHVHSLPFQANIRGELDVFNGDYLSNAEECCVCVKVMPFVISFDVPFRTRYFWQM